MTEGPYTTQQAADLLGVSDSRVRQLATELSIGETIQERRGPVLQFSAADLAALGERNTQRGRPRKETAMNNYPLRTDYLEGRFPGAAANIMCPRCGQHPDQVGACTGVSHGAHTAWPQHDWQLVGPDADATTRNALDYLRWMYRRMPGEVWQAPE